ncbi:MAG: DUF5610 domain-containing protein [Motiliproteus sp.]
MYVSFNSQESYFRQQSYVLTSNGHGEGRDNKSDSVSATDHMLNKLAEKIPGMSSSEMKSLSADQFSPEKVADRIADFVSQGLEQARRDGKSEGEIQKLYEQAVKGIEQGFSEAKDILKDMNLLSDDIEATIDTTIDLTMQKIDALNPAPVDKFEGPTSTSMLAAERYSESESFSLKLRTQDGDKVVIKFDSASSYESSFGAYNDGEGNSATSFSIDRSESSNFKFSVKGELDEGEIDAIQNLIKDVSLIADDFFDGDIQAAFDQASEFQMDKTELASMHLKLTQSQEYSAVSAYQQVQDMGAQPAAPKLGHMLQDLKDNFSNPALGFLQSPFGLGQDLLANLIPQDTRYQQAEPEQQSQFDRNLMTMRDMLSTLAEQKHPDHFKSDDD